MDLMLRVNKVEMIGSGISRIKDSMKAYGLDVKFESTGFFTVILKRPSIQIVDKSSQKSSQKILTLIADNKNITIEEIARFTNISTRAVKKNIAKLKQEGKIKRIGPDKGGYWEIIK